LKTPAAVLATHYLLGLIFAVGLMLAGMTRPGKVVAFLDVSDAWDPSLALVMGGAIVVHTILYRVILKRPSPIFGGRFAIPTRNDITGRLVVGSALFGVGWGLGGFCPGPALSAAGTFGGDAVVFVVSMLAGMGLFQVYERWQQARAAALDGASPTSPR
jgi:uncharacterized membrane protein YedE/YeeE